MSEYDRLVAMGDTAGAAAYAKGQSNAGQAAYNAGNYAASFSPAKPTMAPTGPVSMQAPALAPKAGLLSGPGAYETWLKGNKDNLSSTPTAISGINGISDPGGYQAWLNGAGAAGPQMGASSGVLGSLGGPTGSISAGNSSGVLGSLTTGPTGQATGNTNSRGVLDTLATGPSNSTAVYGDAKGALSSPGAYENFYAMYGGDPMQKSYTETLYEGGLGQLDPYYDYAEKRSIDAAQRASAARGGFNSGLAAQQESDITSNLRGQQAKTWVDLAPTADAAKRARYQQGSDFANTAQQSEEGRWKGLSGMAAAGDAADSARANTRVSAASAADASANTAYNNYWTALNNAGANRISAASNADRASIDSYAAENTALNNANRTRVDAASNADDAAYKAYTGQRDAYATGGSLGLATQNSNINLAGQKDSTDFARFMGTAGLNRDLQTTAQDRLSGGLNATAGQSQRESQLAADIYGDMSSVNGLDSTALQALADKYGIDLQKMKDVVSAGGDILGNLIKLLGK